MKKLVLVVLLAAVGAYFAYNWIVPPERRACSRMATLCGEAAKDVERCVQQVNEMQRTVGAEATKKMAGCMNEAKTCAEAAGCAAGAGVGAIGDAIGEFFRGFGKGAAK